MICKCYLVVFYIVHVTAFSLGGGGLFFGHGVLTHGGIGILTEL